MSRHNASQSFRVQDLVKQVTETEPEEWESIFDITKLEDGTILDILEDKVFETIHDWAIFNVQMEERLEDDEGNYSYRYDDE